jgi:hypothetical protein
MPVSSAASPTSDRWGFVRRHGSLVAVAAVAAVYVVTLALLPLEGVWINDVGNRVIQMKSIVADGYSDFSIRWPGQALDATFDYVPIAYPFSVVRNDKLYSVYSPVFATVASPFYRLMGAPGLYVLPLAASLAMLVGVAKLAGVAAGSAGRGRRAGVYAVFISGLCTPVWFYSLTFWEHTLAACFCIWGVLSLVRFLGGGRASGRRADLVGAAVLPGLGTYFRAELYLFSLIVLLVVVWRGPGRKLVNGSVFALVTLGTLVPLWLFHAAAVGSPLGPHVGTLVSLPSGIAGHLKTRLMMFYSLFCRSAVGTAWSIALTAPFVAMFSLRPRLSPTTFRAALPVSALVALVASGLAWLSFWALGDRPTPVALVGGTNSLFAVAPLLMLGLLRSREARDPGDVLGFIAVAYALVYWLAAPAVTKWGIHWGNRYLLVLYPVLAVLAGVNLADWLASPGAGRLTRRLSIAAFCVLAATSLALQVWSVQVLERKMDFSERFNREVASRPEEIVVTDQWWVGQELHSQFLRKPIFLVTSKRGYDDLAGRLEASGPSEILFIAPTVPGARPEAGTVQIADNGLGYWNLDLVPIKLQPTHAR